jgi:ribosomal protein L12E/L44/L45/RPP1/RPP2
MLSLARESRVREVLVAAGFDEVTIRAEDVVMTLGGGDLEAATDLFLEVGPVAGALREADADEATRARAREVVRKAFEAHAEGGGLSLGSGCWLVSAIRP